MNSASTADGKSKIKSTARVRATSVSDIGDGSRHPDQRHGSRLLAFFEELRRRSVCRAVTTYAVTLWLISQVVDLTYIELGLPEWTLRFVIVAGLAGLPITLFASWLLELTPNGIVVDSRSRRPTDLKRSRADRILDGVLLAAAFAIAANLVLTNSGQSSPPAKGHYERIAVESFRVGPGDDSRALSVSLTTELVHELLSATPLKVVAPRDPYSARNCLTLTGSIAADSEHIRVTVALIDSGTTEVVWSNAIQRARTDTRTPVADIAKDIVALLQVPSDGFRLHGE